MIVFIGCVKLKQNKECKAEDMYISSLFKYSLLYAKKLNPTNIFILSAKYGVLDLNKIIKPYEETLSDKNIYDKKRWAYKCYKQLEEKNIDFNEEAIWLCGNNYNQYLSQKFKNNKFPLANLRMGYRLKYLKDHILKN